jgi:hypothetical protein
VFHCFVCLLMKIKAVFFMMRRGCSLPCHEQAQRARVRPANGGRRAADGMALSFSFSLRVALSHSSVIASGNNECTGAVTRCRQTVAFVCSAAHRASSMQQQVRIIISTQSNSWLTIAGIEVEIEFESNRMKHAPNGIR